MSDNNQLYLSFRFNGVLDVSYNFCYVHFTHHCWFCFQRLSTVYFWLEMCWQNRTFDCQKCSSAFITKREKKNNKHTIITQIYASDTIWYKELSFRSRVCIYVYNTVQSWARTENFLAYDAIRCDIDGDILCLLPLRLLLFCLACQSYCSLSLTHIQSRLFSFSARYTLSQSSSISIYFPLPVTSSYSHTLCLRVDMLCERTPK